MQNKYCKLTVYFVKFSMDSGDQRVIQCVELLDHDTA